MRLRCNECNNEDRFTAKAKANIDVTIDGNGRVVDPRASQQPLNDIIVIVPCKCNICGSTDKIIDLDKE